MFKTALKMFKANSILGLGPKSYRYYCNDDAYISYYPYKPSVIDNTSIEIYFGWKELRNFKIVKYFVEEGDTVDFGDKLFLYHFIGEFAIGEPIVFVIAGGRHRDETIKAVQEVIIRYKKEPALWKKEVYIDGTHEWLSGA